MIASTPRCKTKVCQFDVHFLALVVNVFNAQILKLEVSMRDTFLMVQVIESVEQLLEDMLAMHSG